MVAPLVTHDSGIISDFSTSYFHLILLFMVGRLVILIRIISPIIGKSRTYVPVNRSRRMSFRFWYDIVYDNRVIYYLNCVRCKPSYLPIINSFFNGTNYRSYGEILSIKLMQVANIKHFTSTTILFFQIKKIDQKYGLPDITERQASSCTSQEQATNTTTVLPTIYKSSEPFKCNYLYKVA